MIQKPQAQVSEAHVNIKMFIELLNEFIDDLMQEQMAATFEVNPVKCYFLCLGSIGYV